MTLRALGFRVTDFYEDSRSWVEIYYCGPTGRVSLNRCHRSEIDAYVRAMTKRIMYLDNRLLAGLADELGVDL